MQLAASKAIDWILMNYPHLVALIDLELERLRQARQILLTLQPFSAPRQITLKRSSRASSKPSPIALVAEVVASAASVQPAKVTVESRQAKPTRERRGGTPSSPAPTLGNAFRRPLHTKPVFVSAERIPKRRVPDASLGQVERRNGTDLAGELLTAEALARHWLQSRGA